MAERVRAKDYQLVRSLVSNVQVTPREVRIELAASSLLHGVNLEATGDTDRTISLVAAVRLTKTGHAVRLVHSNGLPATAGKADEGLVKLLLQARRWWSSIATGEIDVATLCKLEGVNDSWMSRVIRMNFLAPRIVEAILEGTQPVTLSATWLRREDLPLDWEKQEEALAA